MIISIVVSRMPERCHFFNCFARASRTLQKCELDSHQHFWRVADRLEKLVIRALDENIEVGMMQVE